MWEQAQFWVSVVSATAAVIAALAAVGFLRKEKIVKGELYTTQQERDDLRKRLAQADARLMFVDPERFLDQADELAASGKYAELDTLATRFTERQSEAFGRAAEILTEQRILDSESDPLAIEDARRFAQIGLAADPQNKRLAEMQDLATTRAQDIARGDPIEALNWEGMSDVELNSLSLALEKDGHYVLAEVAARRSVPLALLRTGEMSQNYSRALGHHANCIRVLGQSELAEQMHREALRIDKETLGTSHPGYAMELNNLASAIREQGRYEEAERLYREALEIIDAQNDKIRPIRATYLSNLAAVIELQQRFEEAEKLYREALAIDEATIGIEHPDYAGHLNNLALLLKEQGRHQEASDLFQSALKIHQDQMREEHPTTTIIQNNLDALTAKHEPEPEA